VHHRRVQDAFWGGQALTKAATPKLLEMCLAANVKLPGGDKSKNISCFQVRSQAADLGEATEVRDRVC
jgi:hypothetical protein